MKIEFKPDNTIKALLKALAYIAIVSGVCLGVCAIAKVPMTPENYCIVLASCAIFLHFYDKKEE